jgi:hypothetical protein
MQDTSVYRPELLIDELRDAIAESNPRSSTRQVDATLIAVFKALVARKLIRLVVAPGVGEE